MRTSEHDSGAGPTISGHPSASGRLSTTDSESEDLELSSWESDASNKPIARGRARRASVTLGDRMVMDPPGSEGVVISKEDRRMADAKVSRNLAVNACFIGLWYTFSLLISIYNKWMFGSGHLNFRFPLFVTCIHMLVQFSLASLVLFAFPQFRPGNFSGVSHHHHGQRGASTERQKQQEGKMTKWFYLTRVGPCGAATGLDIGLGNMSLKFISLAFYTMCKSSSLAFVLIFAFIFRLEKPTWILVGIISIMTVGVIMMVSSESEATFVLIGFILIMIASALSGLRWALTQVLLVRNPATSNPFSTIFFLAPVMFVSILVVAIPVEGFGPLFSRFGGLVQEWGFASALGILVCPGVIAFLMVASEFALLQRSSVVTLSVAGIFKEIMTITAAAIIFGDPLTTVNISGLAVTIVSVGWYNWWKIRKMREDALEETINQGASEGEYVAVGEQGDAQDVGEDDDGNSTDEEERRRRRRKRKAAKAKAAAKSKGNVKGNRKGKGKTTTADGEEGDLLQKVDEDEEESEPEHRPTVEEEEEATERVKQGVVSSGSGAKVAASAAVADTISLHGDVRLRSGSLSSVESSPPLKAAGAAGATTDGEHGAGLL